jgi:hypothetical protein
MKKRTLNSSYTKKTMKNFRYVAAIILFIFFGITVKSCHEAGKARKPNVTQKTTSGESRSSTPSSESPEKDKGEEGKEKAITSQFEGWKTQISSDGLRIRHTWIAQENPEHADMIDVKSVLQIQTNTNTILDGVDQSDAAVQLKFEKNLDTGVTTFSRKYSLDSDWQEITEVQFDTSKAGLVKMRFLPVPENPILLEGYLEGDVPKIWK